MGSTPTQLTDLLPEEHKAFVDDILERYDVPPMPEGLEVRRGIGGMRIDPKSMAPLLDVCFDHRPSLVASALGPPPPHFLERAHSHDIPVAALAGNLEHARRHAEAGADMIVAQGTEAGGHTGLVATMVLVPEVVDAVAPRPVLAAGGIARGRQLAAGLALGADGVWCGSVWLTTEEAETPPSVKEQVPGRRLVGHGPVPVDDRQARPHAAHGLDRRVGAARGPWAAAHADAADPHRPRAPAPGPGGRHRGQRRPEAGDLLRGPGRRAP